MSPRAARPPDDAELVTRALSGSQQAYRHLLVRYQRPILSMVRRMVGDPAAAEDLAQEVFVKAFRALDSFDRSRKFSSWMFKIAHNATIDFLRKRELETVALQTPGEERLDLINVLADPGAESPEVRVERRDLARALEEAVSRLRPEYRQVIVLRYGEGMAYEEIAELIDLPLGTVKTHLFRARKVLAQDLEGSGWAPAKGSKKKSAKKAKL